MYMKLFYKHRLIFLNQHFIYYSKGAFLRPGPLKKICNFAEKSRLFQPPPLSQISKFSKRDYNKLLMQSGTFICYQNIMVYIKKISISEIFFAMIGANFADRYVIACYFLIALFMSPATIPSQSLLQLFLPGGRQQAFPSTLACNRMISILFP